MDTRPAAATGVTPVAHGQCSFPSTKISEFKERTAALIEETTKAIEELKTRRADLNDRDISSQPWGVDAGHGTDADSLESIPSQLFMEEKTLSHLKSAYLAFESGSFTGQCKCTCGCKGTIDPDLVEARIGVLFIERCLDCTKGKCKTNGNGRY